jgi:hypothetical protein
VTLPPPAADFTTVELRTPLAQSQVATDSTTYFPGAFYTLCVCRVAEGFE